MKRYDISLPVTGDTDVWPGHPAVDLRRFRSMSKGEKNNITYLGMTVHTGTHIDAPFHFIDNGSTTESLSLDTLIGPCVVLEIPLDRSAISSEILKPLSFLQGKKRVLFKTANSMPHAIKIPANGSEPVFLSSDGAQFLIDSGVQLVGIDSQSIASLEEGVKTHRLLLQSEIIILEGLDLAEVPRGEYELICLPLKTSGLDGAPARAILEQRQEKEDLPQNG